MSAWNFSPIQSNSCQNILDWARVLERQADWSKDPMSPDSCELFPVRKAFSVIHREIQLNVTHTPFKVKKTTNSLTSGVCFVRKASVSNYSWVKRHCSSVGYLPEPNLISWDVNMKPSDIGALNTFPSINICGAGRLSWLILMRHVILDSPCAEW